MDFEQLSKEHEIIKRLAKAEELVWINSAVLPATAALAKLSLTEKDIEDAEARLHRFAPFIMTAFPETKAQQGLIESPLIMIPAMQNRLEYEYGMKLSGKLYLKQDSHLAIAGSVKARGGIYEVLKHAEELALEQGLLTVQDDYAVFASDAFRQFFGQYKIQVGSTGNLGLSIGIMSAVLGFQVVVHMSADAREWKKNLLRSYGVTVREYESDYSLAVKEGRRESDEDPMSYFVDDENSVSLFLGYAAAAKRLKLQLGEQRICADQDHPLIVYLPCGVGGAPGGIAFGLKTVFGDYVHCFFAEPVQAPCMVLGMASGLHNRICVQDIGLHGRTKADGLAVGRASGFVGSAMEHLLSGIFTVEDQRLYPYMRALFETEEIFIEPSACAAFAGPVNLMQYAESRTYVEHSFTKEQRANAVHIVWATGGRLVPDEVRSEYFAKG